MNTFEKYQNNKLRILDKLQKIEEQIGEASKFGIDIDEAIDKIKRTKETIKDEKLKIVLIGGFSEGKTSLVASWIGKIDESMKIDPLESSDELIIYKPEGFEDDCEIIDSPGLFGFKEKA